MGLSTSSIQVSVISRNDRVNVINYSNRETLSSITSKDESGQSKSFESSESLGKPSSSENGDHVKAVTPLNDSNTEPVLSSTMQPNILANAQISSPNSETSSDRDEQQGKSSLIACTECGTKLKSRRAMLTHLDRHLSIPVSCRACHRSFNSLAALRFHYEDFCISKTLICPQCEEVSTPILHQF